MPTCQVFTDVEISSFRKGGKVLRSCLDHMATLVRPGVQTIDLDRIAEEFIRDHGGVPAFKGFHGFPGTLCTSINEQCVHGMPSERALKEGDIISIDCGVIWDELYTDACITVGVGEISEKAAKLLETTKGALKEALKVLRAGVHTGDISSVIEQTALQGGAVPLSSLTGHGLGRTLHQYPDIPNSGEKGTGPKLPAGTVVAIEPILSLGSRQVSSNADGWTLEVKDCALSAHFEHTVLITDKGHEVIA